ncbi:MAG: choice-of-anchor tandem repeat GloVer-containing protein [Candidatus Sulfotelmatobacter sp.]
MPLRGGTLITLPFSLIKKRWYDINPRPRRELMTSINPALRLCRFAPFLIMVACTLAAGQQESSLYSFRFNGTDGFDPIVGLVSDKAGNLYGTTPYGGTYNDGAIFELSPPSSNGGLWSETILYNFTGGVDGGNPSAPLILDKSGNLYSTTAGGVISAQCPTGCGSVFELSPPAIPGGSWSYSFVYQFSPSSPSKPFGGVVRDQAGHLYGATLDTPTGAGTAFELIPPSAPGGVWTEKVLYSFSGGSNDSATQTTLAIGKNHALYGTTQGGGASNNGTVFELAPPSNPGAPWTKTTLYSFLGGNDGSGLDAGVALDPQGNVYGTTAVGGPMGVGTVFELIPPAVQGGKWTEVILYAFQAAVGAVPYDTPIIDSAGNLYGTTSQGGPHNVGMVFKLAPPLKKGGAWTFTTLHDFTGGAKSFNEGAFPWGGSRQAMAEVSTAPRGREAPVTARMPSTTAAARYSGLPRKAGGKPILTPLTFP